jgi:hypothetical protein
LVIRASEAKVSLVDHRTRRCRLNELPFPLLVILVILAVIIGLVVGARAGRIDAMDRKKNRGKSTAQRVGRRARELATSGVVSMWKWNRARKRKAAASSRDDDEDEER